MDATGAQTPYRQTVPSLKPERSSGPPPQPWTASRCQRLLRPLLTHIASWRANVASPAAASQASQRDATAGPKRSRNDECDWLVPKKKLRRTYASRQRRQSPALEPQCENSQTAKSLLPDKNATARDGEIIAPTPLLRRARGLSMSSPGGTEGLPTAIDAVQARRLKKLPASLNRTLPNNLQRCLALCSDPTAILPRDLESICRSLDALLKATAHESLSENSRPTGARSFLGMCLRKVPDYISELEAWEKREAEENGTSSAMDGAFTSNNIYGYLESLGVVRGWKHLRAVARADGIRAVKKAISDSLFDVAFTHRLIYICIMAGAGSEASELVEATLHVDFPRPLAPDTCFGELRDMQPIAYLTEFARVTGYNQFFLRQCRLLLETGQLPQDWLVTHEAEHMWEVAVRSLSKSSDATDAVEFASTSVLLLADRPRRIESRAEYMQLENDLRVANTQALVSILTILTSMSFLGEKEMQSAALPDARRARITIVGERLRYILQVCAAEYKARKRGRASYDNGHFLELALYLSSDDMNAEPRLGDSVRAAFETTWRHCHHPNTKHQKRKGLQFDMTVSLISSVARAYSRGLSVTANESLDMVFERLGKLSLDVNVFEHLKAAAAFQLAQQTNSVRDLIYAEKLTEQTTRTREDGGDGCAPAMEPKALFVGYRWEETIGEWVVESPVASRKAAAAKRVLRSSKRSAPVSPTPPTTVLERGGSAERQQDGAQVLPSPSEGESSGGGEEESEEDVGSVSNSDLRDDAGACRSSPLALNANARVMVAAATRNKQGQQGQAQAQGTTSSTRRRGRPRARTQPQHPQEEVQELPQRHDQSSRSSSGRRGPGRPPRGSHEKQQKKPPRRSLLSLLPSDACSSDDELGL